MRFKNASKGVGHPERLAPETVSFQLEIELDPTDAGRLDRMALEGGGQGRLLGELNELIVGRRARSR